MSHNRSICIAIFALFANMLSAGAATHMYDQLMPQMLKTINIEEPSEQELLLINSCRAHSEGGLKYPAVGTENWQAINSIDMFKFILPAYARNITASGYIALARQVAQMTDKKATLETRTDLTQYLVKNTDSAQKIDKILNNAITSEQKFFHLFRQIDEEEQAELDKTHGQLYFDPVWYRPNLETLNESSFALEVGPRLNQLCTAATYTVPTVFSSYVHHMVNIGQKCNSLSKDLGSEKIKFADYTKSVEEANLESTLYRWAVADYNATKAQLKTQHLSKLSKIDRAIVESDSLDSLPYKAKEQFFPSFTRAAMGMTYDGIRNLPNFAKATGETVYQHITSSPFYEEEKKRLLERNQERFYIENTEFQYSSADIEERAVFHNRACYVSMAFWGSIYTYIAYWRFNKTKSLLDLIYEKQQDLLSAGHLVKSMQLLHKVIGADTTLQKLMASEHAKLGELFDANSKKTSVDLKNLINALMSSSFQGSSSYLFSQQGKILATHHLLNRIKAELIPYLEAFGQVDAYLSTAKLYQEFANHPRVHFCLPEFVEANTPVMDAQEYWHPMINAHKVVTNTLAMNNRAVANLIITGPNAGGKTTSLMSLIINIIFAQSWGIAPSSSLRLTPFAKIHSYLDITTNLQEGLSLFAAEVDRAKKLKVSIMSCTPGQKTFTIIDEIFSGTDPKVASDVGFTFAAQLGEMAHSMTIITTHFPALTELQAKDKNYVNYKVADATIHEDGSITYPFKLVPGISSQNIAAQMLHNQGII